MITDSNATPTEVCAPCHDHRQHVAAELIGAEPVMRIGRPQLVDDATDAAGSYGVQNCAIDGHGHETAR